MQGVRQGCQVSILLSIIVADILANFIDSDKRIKGMQIGYQEIKIVNFAANTTIF